MSGRALETKTFEIRDRMTFIPALMVRLNTEHERDRYLVARAGYGRTGLEQGCHFILVRLTDCKASNDEYDWGGRTMAVAHKYIAENWDALTTGAVVDVEFILGEKPKPKHSEQEECPL